MKKIINIFFALTLILGMIGGIAGQSSRSSAAIYFAGDYRKKIASKEYYVLQMNQYSSPEGKEVGNYTLFYYYKPSGGMNPWKEGTLKKIGKNKYKSGKMRFKIYKKKVVITKGGEYNGTYKLKKHFYS